MLEVAAISQWSHFTNKGHKDIFQMIVSMQFVYIGQKLLNHDVTVVRVYIREDKLKVIWSLADNCFTCHLRQLEAGSLR